MKKTIIKQLTALSALAAVSFLGAATAHADLVTSVFDSSWTAFQDNNVNNGYGEDYVGSGGKVNPGWGGQDFDAEYLLYKVDYAENELYLGFQAGFDIVDGQQLHGGTTYYAGDLALSFDGDQSAGDSSTWEYAIDFGWETKGYDGTTTYTHTSGLYQVTDWDDSVYHGFTASNPFAMATGTLAGTGALGDQGSGYDSGADSYWRIASISLADVGITAKEGFHLAAHWTMSCGNDAMTGATEVAPVPEPATMFLLGTGLIGLASISRRKRAAG